MTGLICILLLQPIEGYIERSKVYRYYRIKKGTVDSRNQLKKRLRQIDWNSKDGKVLSMFAKKAIDIG